MELFKIIITEKADTEYQNGFWYYEEKQKGLGFRFESETELLLQQIKKNPRLFPRKYKKYREALVKQ